MMTGPTSKPRRTLLIAAPALLLGRPRLASAQDSADATAALQLPAQVTVGEHTLACNGAGIRTKWLLQVYAAALYLPQPAHDWASVAAQTGAQRLHLQVLRHLEVSALTHLFEQGLQRNVPAAELAPLQADIAQLNAALRQHPQLHQGDRIDIDWVPGTGMVVQFNGQAQHPVFTQRAVFLAVLRIWLGPYPNDPALQAALLGRTP